jgi:hypothetical protein
MQKPLEFAEIAIRNLHRNLAEIRHRKLTNHIRITQLTCGLPATPSPGRTRPAHPNPAPAAKSTQPHHS